MTDDNLLDLYIEGRYAGRLTRLPNEAVDFDYASGYANDPIATPVSLSMPKTIAHHSGDVAGRWISNLLPDSDARRKRIGQKFAIKRPTAFNLLRHIGFDAAGAVQIVPVGITPNDDGNHVEYNNEDLGAELRNLRADPDHLENPFGRWSLAGQQGKIALSLIGGKWCVPTGAAPSTHIFKVGIGKLEHSDVAEFVTLRACALLDIPAAKAVIREFDGTPAVVVERYDRVTSSDGSVSRIHQEDMCQAAGMGANLKYQDEGGSSVEDLALLLQGLPAATRTSEMRRFAQLVTFNALTFSPDAHAKNYSLLLRGPNVDLAPAYDLMSNVLLHDLDAVKRETSLAMKFGSSKYRARDVRPESVVRAAGDMLVDREWLEYEVVRQVAGMTDAMSGAIDEAAALLGEKRVGGDVLRSRVDVLGLQLGSTFGRLTDEVLTRLLT